MVKLPPPWGDGDGLGDGAGLGNGVGMAVAAGAEPVGTGGLETGDGGSSDATEPDGLGTIALRDGLTATVGRDGGTGEAQPVNSAVATSAEAKHRPGARGRDCIVSKHRSPDRMVWESRTESQETEELVVVAYVPAPFWFSSSWSRTARALRIALYAALPARF